MKELIRQFYTEGLAYTFYVKPVNYLNKKIKNKHIVSFLSFIIKLLYTILALSFALYILYKKIK